MQPTANKQTGYVFSALQVGIGALLTWKTSGRSAGSMLIGSGLRSVYYTYTEPGERIDSKVYLRHSVAGAVGGLFANVNILPQAGLLINKAANVVAGILGGVAVQSIQEGQLPEKSKLAKEFINGSAGPLAGALVNPVAGTALSFTSLSDNLKTALSAVLEASAGSGANKLADNMFSGKEYDKDVLEAMTLGGLLSAIINGGVLGLRLFPNARLQQQWEQYRNIDKDRILKMRWIDDNIKGPDSARLMVLFASHPSHPEIAKAYLLGRGYKPEIAEQGVECWKEIFENLEVLDQLFSHLQNFKETIERYFPFHHFTQLRLLFNKPSTYEHRIVDSGSPALIHHLSVDILSKVFSQLPQDDLKNCQRVCKPWNKLLQQERFREMCGITESFKRLSAGQRLLEEIPLYKRFKRFYRFNVIVPTAYRFFKSDGVLAYLAFASMTAYFSYLIHQALRNLIRELEQSPLQVQLTRMEDFNRSPVLIWQSEDRYTFRRRLESEKFTDVNEFVRSFRKDKNVEEIIALFYLNFHIPVVFLLLYDNVINLASRVKGALKENLIRNLRFPDTLLQDPILQRYADPVTGKVMSLPVETKMGEIFDLLSLLDPITGKFTHPVSHAEMFMDEITFREDLFNEIHSRLTTQKICGALPGFHGSYYQTREIVRENRSIDPDYIPEISGIAADNSLGATIKTLQLLRKIDRSSEACRNIIQILESRVNAFIKTQPKQVFYDLIDLMKEAEIGMLHLPFKVEDADLERMRGLRLHTLSIGYELSEEIVRSDPASLITIEGLSCLQNMPLRTLMLRNCPCITSLQPLSEISTLKYLSLSWCSHLGRGLQDLADSSLEELDITGVDVNDSIIPVLSRIPLKKLVVKRTNISVQGIESLKRDGLEIQ